MHGDPTAVKFPAAQLKHRDRKDKADAGPEPRFDFSYSGIKTSVLRYVEVHGLQPSIEARRKALTSMMANQEKPTLEDFLRHCDTKTLNLVFLRVPDPPAFQKVAVQVMTSSLFTAPFVKCETGSSTMSSSVSRTSDTCLDFVRAWGFATTACSIQAARS